MDDYIDGFFTFRRMISPVIIGAFTWILTALIVLACLAAIGLGLGQRNRTEAAAGLLTLILGPLVVRVVGEMLILFFRMNETLSDIAQELERR